jgi:hypothetical protein
MWNILTYAYAISKTWRISWLIQIKPEHIHIDYQVWNILWMSIAAFIFMKDNNSYNQFTEVWYIEMTIGRSVKSIVLFKKKILK